MCTTKNQSTEYYKYIDEIVMLVGKWTMLLGKQILMYFFQIHLCSLHFSIIHQYNLWFVDSGKCFWYARIKGNLNSNDDFVFNFQRKRILFGYASQCILIPKNCFPLKLEPKKLSWIVSVELKFLVWCGLYLDTDYC